METFQTSFNSNTTSANEALKSLDSFFKTEKTKLQEIRTGIKTDHESFQANILSQLSQLKDELMKESTLKDSLALKSEESKVLSTKLEASEKQHERFHVRYGGRFGNVGKTTLVQVKYPRSVLGLENFIVDHGLILSNKFPLETFCESAVILTRILEITEGQCIEGENIQEMLRMEI
ncbi:unnamed protein product [Lactuca virosa]|uniref:FRIGIDA-like protein n=1 Tax=Lactuca virosa TaxID=75947 RepID=A0AAU9MI35_9ASTR|nr:unnamed protein product [Lactuca virosa]